MDIGVGELEYWSNGVVEWWSSGVMARVCLILMLAVSLPAWCSEEKPFSSKVGVHLIGEYTPGSQAMVRGRMPVLKILDPWGPMIQAARDYKKHNPRGTVVLRCYEPIRYTLADDPEARAREYWEKIIWARISKLSESDRRLIDYIEATNEGDECPTWADQDSVRWFTKFSTEFADLCGRAGFKPCLASIAVGNPPGDPEELRAKIRQYAPALRVAKKFGGAWSYHSYTIEYTTDPAIEYWYSLRYRQFYEVFTGEYADLAGMPMILTEGGVDRAGNKDLDGWSARGSAEKFQGWLRWFDSEVKKDKYVIGVTLFQNGDPKNWTSFDLEPLAGWLVEYWAQNEGDKKMKIGFVDHHLNNYHADKFLSLVRGPLSDLGAEIAIAWESDPRGDDWCEKNNVLRAASASEVAEKSDAVIVLAPDNIEDHLKLCREVLPHGKPTAIDKALAFNTADAKAIVELARKHKTPITSSSALAFAVELEDTLPRLEGTPLEVWAAGMGEWKNYGLHTLSMVLRLMGPGIKRVMDTGTESSRMVTLDYGEGRKGYVTVRWADNMWEIFPWTLGIRVSHEKFLQTTIRDFDGFYANLMRRNIEFFRTGDPGFPGDLAMELVAVLEAAEQSQASGDWVELR